VETLISFFHNLFHLISIKGEISFPAFFSRQSACERSIERHSYCYRGGAQRR
jgi:hypothetical protein